MPAASSFGISDEKFVSQIAPLMVDNCIACHNDRTAEGGYRLTRVHQMFSPGWSGARPIIPNAPEESEIYRRIASSDPDERMPPHSALSDSEIQQVEEWIRSGASTSEVAEETLGAIAAMADVRLGSPNHYEGVLPISAVAISTADQRLYVAGIREVIQWNYADEKLERRWQELGYRITAITVSNDGHSLAVASGIPGQFGQVDLIRPYENDSPQRIFVDADPTQAIALSPDGTKLAIGCSDGSVRVFATPDGKELFASQAHADSVQSVQWDSSGTRLATAGRDRSAKLLRADGWQWKTSFDKHERSVGGVAFMKSGVATLDETGKLRLWPFDSGEYTITSSEGYSRRSVLLLGADSDLFVMFDDRVSKLRVDWEDVSDGKDDKGNPKTRKQAYWKRLAEFSIPQDKRILSYAHRADALVAGLSSGEICLWRHGEDEKVSNPKILRVLP